MIGRFRVPALWIIGALTLILPFFLRDTTPVVKASTNEQSTGVRPNFVIIISDDQRYDTMKYMPRTTSLIFDQGVTFDKAYVTTSRCCPSRSSILTGLYVHNHGVYTNGDNLEKTTFVEVLHDAGYYTGVIGKYLNSYPDKIADPPLSEFDVWTVFKQGKKSDSYFDPELNIDGTVASVPGYTTYILRDFAVEFIQNASKQDQPFLLLLDSFAPHLPATPAPGDEALYADLEPFRPPNFNEEDVSDKPQWLGDLPLLRDRRIERIEADRLNQIQSLNALDVTVESVIQELDNQGVLDNTVVIYLSDNGFFWGEHRLPGGKIFVYEPSIHVPFAIRYPALLPEPYVEHALVANIDIAPTIYDLADVEPHQVMDGRSLVSLLQGEEWRTHLLIEGWPIAVDEVQAGKPFQAIHTGRYVYVETKGDRSELYDLEVDPYQLESQISNVDYADTIAQLRDILIEERKSIPPGPMDDLETVKLNTPEIPELTDEPQIVTPEETILPSEIPEPAPANVVPVSVSVAVLAVVAVAIVVWRKAKSS
jgi:N-acetylglucosamine-6-sulfatase